MNNMNEIAKNLLDIKAVFLSPTKPFTWASGIKSPIYCDNRLTLSYPEIRSNVAKKMAEIISKKYPECEIVMGTATAGIPHATLASYFLEKPCGYVRGKAKDHGRQNQIEGKYEKGQKVVLIEDLISTGGSSLEAVEALRSEGLEVLGVISIFTYQMKKAVDAFANANCEYTSLATFDELIDAAVELNYISQEEALKVRKFKENPQDESWINA